MGQLALQAVGATTVEHSNVADEAGVGAPEPIRVFPTALESFGYEPTTSTDDRVESARPPR